MNLTFTFRGFWVSLLTVISLLTTAHLQAQCTSPSGVIINNNSTSGNFRGFNPRHMSGRSVFIISAAEMAAAGITNGMIISGMKGSHSTAPTTAVSGTYVVYLQNSTDASYLKGTDWTAATTGMTIVNNDPMSVAAGAVAWGPSSFTVTGTPTTFTYTGGSVYVATEWINCGAKDGGAIIACNNGLVGGANGLVSSQSTTTCTPIAAMSASSFRPYINFVANYPVDVVVRECWAQGKTPIGLNTTNVIGGTFYSFFPSTENVTATLTVKDKVSGTVRYTENQTFSVGGCSSQTFTSTSWIPTIAETDSVILTTVPLGGESNTANNKKAREQLVNWNIYDYGNISAANNSGTGFGTASGILVSKYTITGTATITSVKVRISNFANFGAGNTVYGVVLNSSGTIVAQSANYVLQAADQGNYVTFTLSTPPSFTNATFYVGMAQTANTTVGYFPWGGINDLVRQPALFYTTPLAGGTPAEITNSNLRFWQEATMFTYNAVLAGGDTICSGGNSNLTVTMSGGTGPYTVVYSDGTNNTTVTNYTSGANISVSPSSTKTYSLVSVVDATGTYSTNPSGTGTVTLRSSTNATIPTTAGAHFATHSCVEGSWTYFFENAKLLLGLEMGSWNPGTFVQTTPGPGQYAVRVDIGASPTTNLTTAPYNTSGKDWIVMNRTWDVVLDSVSQEPSDSINVRTYFTDAEYQAVNDIFAPADSLTSPSSLTVYKLRRTTPMWQDSAGASSIAYDYSMQALAASHAGLADSNLVLYNNLSSYSPDWVYAANSPSAGIHSVTMKVDEFSGGGGGGGAGGSTPFPIELLSFNGYNQGTNNRLFWITASELNADKFIVERSTDAINYKAVGQVQAVGNSNKQEGYSFNDKTFKANYNFYRLRMIDKDGTFTYSNIIEIASDKLNITVYPNPAQNEVFIAGGFAPNFKASMINILGEEVLNTNLDTQNQTAISLQNIAQGVYMLNILNEKGAVIYSEKLVKE